MNYFGFVSLLNGLFALMTGLYVLVKNRKNPVYLSFSAFAISVALWAILYAVWQSQTEKNLALMWMRLTMAFCTYIPFAFHRFVRCIIEDIPEEKSGLVYSTIPIFFFLTCFTPLMVNDVVPRLFFPFWPTPGLLMHIYVVLFFVVFPYCFYVLFQAWHRATGARRWQLKWVTLTTLCMWGSGSTNWFLWYNIPIPPFPNVFVAVFFLLLAYAIIRRQLFDVDALADIIQEAKLSTIGTLAASINHEIRNPLFVVKGLAESFLVNMRDGLLDQLSADERNRKVEEILNKTIEQISRAVEIMKKFSEFSKPRIGAVTQETVSVTEAVENVLSYVRHELELDKIAVERNLNSEMAVRADRKQLEEVFLNLIINACHAMPTGGLIKISGEQKNGHVNIRISDTGTGIPPDSIKRIFDPFYSTKKDKGSGLGLYIVKKLVERNGGRISVESRAGAGTTFSLELPAS